MKKILCCLIIAVLLTGCVSRTESVGTCRLTVRCDTILARLDELDAAKQAYVPDDGVILDVTDASIRQGDSAFDVLKRELMARNMQFEFSVTPVSGGIYIEGIQNLYEFDMGPLSGWQFVVNGVFMDTDCGGCILSDGDAVELLYTCDLGRDVGGYVEE